ncbi:hypothetical protein BB561_004267 [Smittium simulii]|uniref:Amidophosphoribosyltransferase n=1 Tax=Smittium simulii TaxID=133385 RepID=A0A2T9YH46_9FUNG|nr:hypothetical protein BB561_004267 [Smittium simulii]
MCGIAGLVLADSNQIAAPELLEALNMLQHRGQDSAGIITCGNKGRLYQCKGDGLANEVITSKRVQELKGSIGIGHVRYPTAGTSSSSEAQPFYVNSPYGISLAHNGNLTNTVELEPTNLDKTGKTRINEEDVFNAISELFTQCFGGYACVAMVAGFGVIAFRDPHGIRPISIGKRKSSTIPNNYDYMLSSESAALEALDFDDIESLKNGEAIIITKTGISRRILSNQVFSPCIFEYVYFARPDSIIDGIPVNDARMMMGVKLAETVKRVLGENNDIDAVIPVPDTSRIIALQLSQVLNLPYREGFNKNRYVGRTFIMPGQELRKKTVRRKLNAMRYEFQDKNVLIVDDSIVRGTTSKEIIQMARDAGAKKVYFASAAPAVKYQNVYGIDMPSKYELIAAFNDDKEVTRILGADKVIFQTLPDLVESCRQFNKSITQFDCSVFNGEYITGNISEKYLDTLEMERSESSRRSSANSGSISGIENYFK